MNNRVRPWLDVLPAHVRAAVIEHMRMRSEAGRFLLTNVLPTPDVWIQEFEFACPSGDHHYRAVGLFILNPANGVRIELVRLHTEKLG